MSEPQARVPDVLTDASTGQRIQLHRYQARNKRASWVLALFCILLLALVAYLLAEAFDPASTGIIVAIGLLLGGGQTVVGFWFGDKIALAAAGAREANREEHRYLVNVAEAVAIGAGVPTPAVYVIDSAAPNAFATGRDPKNSSIAVTTGLMAMLDRQELEGVIAHEMAHIKNYDVRFMTLLVATLGALVVLRDVVLRSSFGGRSSRRRSSGSSDGRGQALVLLLLVVLLVLAPVLATLIRLAVSRKREYLADAVGAYITRNPEGLARALEKIQSYGGDKLDVSDSVRPMFFVNPVARLNATELLATHPPVAERIRRLRLM